MYELFLLKSYEYIIHEKPKNAMYKMNKFLYFTRIRAEKFSAATCFITDVDVYCTK